MFPLCGHLDRIFFFFFLNYPPFCVFMEKDLVDNEFLWNAAEITIEADNVSVVRL